MNRKINRNHISTNTVVFDEQIKSNERHLNMVQPMKTPLRRYKGSMKNRIEGSNYGIEAKSYRVILPDVLHLLD